MIDLLNQIPLLWIVDFAPLGNDLWEVSLTSDNGDVVAVYTGNGIEDTLRHAIAIAKRGEYVKLFR